MHARQQCRGGNASTHCAATNNADGLEGPWRNAFEFWQIAHSTFVKERVDHALALVCAHQFDKQFTLAQHPRVEGQFRRRLHGAHGGCGADLTPAFFQHSVIGRVPVDSVWPRQRADRTARRALGEQILRIGKAHRFGVALFDLVDQAHAKRLGRANLTASGDHLDGFFSTRQTRQTLRTAGAGYQAQMHLGQPDTGGRLRDPVMRAQRDLKSAPKRHAVHRGHDNQG